MIDITEYPAPTGVFDYSLRRVGEAISASAVDVKPGPRLTFQVRELSDVGELVPVEATTCEEIATVEAALRSATFDFLRPETIAHEAELPVDTVRRVLETGGIARRPWRRPNSGIYTLASRPPSARERVSAVLGYLGNRL
jgi:hypothetical protein